MVDRMAFHFSYLLNSLVVYGNSVTSHITLIACDFAEYTASYTLFWLVL